MKIGIRIISCIMLSAVALTMAVFTLADFSPEEGYTIGEHKGLVAIYAVGDPEPITVTDIELASLRQTDREMIARGLQAESREELLALLEDIGS